MTIDGDKWNYDTRGAVRDKPVNLVIDVGDLKPGSNYKLKLDAVFVDDDQKTASAEIEFTTNAPPAQCKLSVSLTFKQTKIFTHPILLFLLFSMIYNKFEF